MAKIDNMGGKWLIGIAASFIILAGLKTASAIATPVLLGVFISIILAPPLAFMTKKGLPAGLAILILILLLVAISSLFVVFVSSSIDSFSQQLPIYQENLQAKTLNLLPYLEKLGVPITQEQFLKLFNTDVLFRWSSYVISGIGTLLTNAFITLLVIIFLLMEAAQFVAKLKTAKTQASLDTTGGFINQVNRYLLIKTSASLITGFIVSLALSILGVDFPILWGILAFIMNFIPTIGSIVAAVPPILLSLVQFDLQIAIFVIIIYFAINTLIGNFLEPRFMGKGLGLSPLVVFLSLMVWGYIFGIVGMFLSIPLTMIVKIALENNPATLWLAIMIGNGDDLHKYKKTRGRPRKNINADVQDKLETNTDEQE